MKIKVGDQVWIPGESKSYIVQACNDRYVICTKPYNLKKTVWYFIVDLKEKWRAPDDQEVCRGYETKEDCETRLQELISGEIGLSKNNGVELDIRLEE